MQRNLGDRRLRRVIGAEHEALDASARAIGSESRSRISGRRQRGAPDPEFLGHRNRHAEAARLERSGRQPALVLDRERSAAEAPSGFRRVDQRRRNFAERDHVLKPADRQQLAIAPHAGGAIAEGPTIEMPRQRRQVVAYQERPARLRQPVQLSGRVVPAACRAFQMCDEVRAFDREDIVHVGAALRMARKIA